MECGKVKGAFTADVINVGWYGFRTTKNARIRVGPGDHFPEKQVVMQGKRVGRQSVRNPKGIDNPKPRPVARDQFERPWVWVYDPETSEVGWMKATVLKETNGDNPWAHGPTGRDFHVGLEQCHVHEETSCQGFKRARLRIVNSENVALRYAPNSTAFYYLRRGDGVRELFRRLQNDFSAVSVTQSKTVPVGTRGWVDVRALAGEKATGIDVSSFQGEIDFKAVRGADEDFAICKATEGEGFIDKNFFSNVTNARKALLHVGAFHVLRPVEGRSGTQEADMFIRALKLAKIRSTDIRPTVHIESSKLDRDGTQRYVGEFVGALRIAGYDALLYTYPGFLEWTKAFNTDLWIANYNVARPSLPKPWDDYAVWQYEMGQVPGVKGKVGRNKCPDLSRIIQR